MVLNVFLAEMNYWSWGEDRLGLPFNFIVILHPEAQTAKK
jgi:hypothetical protein